MYYSIGRLPINRTSHTETCKLLLKFVQGGWDCFTKMTSKSVWVRVSMFLMYFYGIRGERSGLMKGLDLSIRLLTTIYRGRPRRCPGSLNPRDYEYNP